MKKAAPLIIYLFILNFFIGFSQSQNNLLWEISKADNPKKSYLYGTMHVNDKISYHLSDAFFDALMSVEVIANESNPETWGDLTNLLYSKDLNNTYKLYTEFYLYPIDKNELKTLFNTSSSYFNNILSGNNNPNADYQEDTVLDMFIFQTGKKYNKVVTGLEDAKTSLIPIYKLNEEEAKPKEENKSLLLKILKNKNLNEFIKEAYREKNIILLDSIYKLMISPKAHDALIVSRNKVMADSMDKVIQEKSLFAAIGAAHLAGDEGVIKLLENKGYTVKPISTELTEKGKNIKKEIENNFPKPVFKTHTTSDQMISLPMNEFVLNDKNVIGSPDYTNGGVIKIIRKPLNNFINKKGNFNYKSLDSLMFEHIPGTIISKKISEKEEYTLFEINNETKTGNKQHFNFYITPLEVISISLTGAKNYAELYSSSVFDNILFKKLESQAWKQYTPKRGGFSILLPEYYIAYGEESRTPENIEIQAYDKQHNSYYFVIERNSTSLNFLEDTLFEEKQIQKEFLSQLDLVPEFITTKNNKVQGSAILGDKKICLQSFIFGNKYYLLGTINAPNEDEERFFSSFKMDSFVYSEEYKTYTDTINNFKVKVPAIQNERLIYGLEQSSSESKNVFNTKNKYISINAENGRKVNINIYNFHKYDYYPTLDSIKKNFKSYFTSFYTPSDEDYYDDEYEYTTNNSILSYSLIDKKGFKKSNWYSVLFKSEEKDYTIIKELQKEDKDNTTTFNFLIGKEGNEQAFKTKILFRKDAYIVLQALVDKKNSEKDSFIETVFSSIQFDNSDFKTDIFKPKFDDFVQDASSTKDTIRYSALHSTYDLEITKEDFPKVIYFLDKFDFKANETNAQIQLLNKLGAIKDENIISFFERYYKKEGITSEIQINILEALTLQKSKEAYQKIMELMEYDLPLSNNEYDIKSLFNKFEENMESSHILFPKIFQFYSIPEYKIPLIDYCNKVIENKWAKASRLKSFRKMILTNAKLEYKRVLSWKQENLEYNQEEGKEILTEQEYAPVEELTGYLNLLEHFKTNYETNDFINKLKKLNITSLDIEIMRLASLSNNLNEEDKKTILKDPKLAFLLMQLEDNTFDLPDSLIAKSALTNFYNVKPNDSITFIKKKIIRKDNHTIHFFFYKISEKEPENYEENLCSFAFVYKNNQPELYTYRYFGISLIKDEEKLEEEFDIIINEAMNEPHLRVNFRKKDKNPPVNYFYDDY